MIGGISERYQSNFTLEQPDIAVLLQIENYQYHGVEKLALSARILRKHIT